MQLKGLREQGSLFTEQLVLQETMGSGIAVDEAQGSGRAELCQGERQHGCEARLGYLGKEGARCFWKEGIQSQGS